MSFKSIKFLFVAVIMTTVSSCGQRADQEIKDAVLSANILLSSSQCQPAIDLLEGIGRQNSNAIYLKTLASAYACRAGYSSVVFFGSDIAKTASPAPLGGMSTYTTSTASVTSPLASDSKFKDLQIAIDILLYAGGIASTTEPLATERAKYFSAGQAGDINAQLTFMMLAQLGKMMKVYGNTSAAGVKGAGTAASNKCFTAYDSATMNTDIQDYVENVLTGACQVTNDSHSELAIGVTGRRARLCQGVVLLNSVLDTLPNVIATASGTSLDNISTVTAQITTVKKALTDEFPTIGTTATVMSQSNCETDSNIDEDTLSAYYAVIFEGLVQ